MYDINEIKKSLENMSISDSLCYWVLNPDVSNMVNEVMQEAVKDYMGKSDIKKHFNYSLNPSGDIEYREEVAKFLTKSYQRSVESTSVFGTYGATHGFNMLMNTFLTKNDYMFFEDLSFNRSIISAHQFDLNVVAVDCDSDGIDIKKLEEQFKICKSKSTHEATEKKPYWAIIYLLSQFHNPKGTCYTEKRCIEIVDLARKYDVLVINDDMYALFNFGDNKAGEIMVAYDKCNWATGRGNIVSNGSFSKILFPSLRMGWLETSPWILNAVENRSDISGVFGWNTFNQGLVVCLLRAKSFPNFFKNIFTYYKEHMFKACDFLDEHSPKGLTYEKPLGSFFLWMKLPENCDASELNRMCNEYNVSFNIGWSYCAIDKDPRYKSCFRLGVTNLSMEDLLKALYVVCDRAKLYIHQMMEE